MLQQQTIRAVLVLAVALLGGCGGGGGDGDGDSAAVAADALPANGQSIRLDEDSLFAGAASAQGLSGPVTFSIASPPAHGTLALTGTTGAYIYTPAADYSGTDSFAIAVTDPAGAGATATTAIQVDAVDDPPEIDPLPDASNSPYEYAVVLPLAIREVDGEPLVVTATAQASSVLEALVDPPGQNLILRPKALGSSRVQVRVADGSTTVTRDLTFTVRDVTRLVEVRSSTPSTQAIALTNTGTSTTDFELTHNGHQAFASMDQILAAVRAQPNEVADEPLERKIWRFIRDNTYHASPVNEEGWMNATWPLLNSFGWGWCSHVSAVFLKIAEAAGYEARAWFLNGHVVPEIQVNGRWQLYDPDLAVYYYRRDGTLAGVEELEADPALVSSPVNPILSPGTDRGAYSPAVASIYGSSADNRIVDSELSTTEPFRGSRITLPAGARLTYPGRWTGPPTGYDGPTPYTIEQFRQARLDLPVNFSGPMSVPWVLWDIQGTGVVRIRGRDFAAGSQELHEFLVRPGASVTEIESVGIQSNLALIMLINPLWYDMLERNDLVLTGKDVWAIQAQSYSLPEANRPPPPVPEWLRRPRAVP